MHPNHFTESDLEMFNTKASEGYDIAFKWLRDNYYMSVNQTKAFLNEAGVKDDTQTNGCYCDLCIYLREYRKRLVHVPEEHRAFFEDLMDAYLEQGMDNDVYEAVIDGSWPDADEWIKNARERRAKREKDEAENDSEG